MKLAPKHELRRSCGRARFGADSYRYASVASNGSIIAEYVEIELAAPVSRLMCRQETIPTEGGFGFAPEYSQHLCRGVAHPNVAKSTVLVLLATQCSNIMLRKRSRSRASELVFLSLTSQSYE